ncbi:hypothetical protein L195_g032238 [Trifolium pratense]|uniref:Uncharacterized protein n=1 Tax=Trifolium pratense TaxID=57577 RepID=A0A2K3LCM4_TRIPR|nr:hypothetical protein L195_g032238 [Trifolium pratense]
MAQFMIFKKLRLILWLRMAQDVTVNLRMAQLRVIIRENRAFFHLVRIFRGRNGSEAFDLRFSACFVVILALDDGIDANFIFTI